MAEPEISIEEGIVRYNCDDLGDYTIEDGAAVVEDDANGGFVIEADMSSPSLEETFEDGDYTASPAWQQYSTLSLETSIVRFGSGSAKAESSTSAQSRIVLPTGSLTTAFLEGWFYDDGGSATGDRGVWIASNATGTPALITWVGIKQSVSTTTYSYYNITTGNYVDSYILRSVGWHKVAISSIVIAGIPDDMEEMKVYLDSGSSSIYTDTVNAPMPRRYGVGTSVDNEELWLDRLRFAREHNLYGGGATIISDEACPDGLISWKNVTVSKLSTVQNNGTLDLYVQFTKQAGSGVYGINAPDYDDGLWDILSDGVIQSFVHPGEGEYQPGLRWEAIFQSSSSGLHTPVLLQVDLTYIRRVSKSFSESLPIVDTVQRGIVRALSDVATVSDALVRSFLRVFSDVLSPVDTLLKTSVRALSEAVALVEQRFTGIQRIASETISLVEIFMQTHGMSASKVIEDSLQIIDSISRSLLKILRESFSVVDRLRVAFNGILTALWSKSTKDTDDDWRKTRKDL